MKLKFVCNCFFFSLGNAEIKLYELPLQSKISQSLEVQNPLYKNKRREFVLSKPNVSAKQNKWSTLWAVTKAVAKSMNECVKEMAKNKPEAKK